MTRKILLASASPRRARILENAGIPFDVMKTGAEEISLPHDPVRTVTGNAAAKLRAAKAALPPGKRDAFKGILAADTIVWFDGRIYGKPRDLEEAARFLEELSGNTHTVFTGVAYAELPDGAIRTECARSEVTFRKLDGKAIAGYVERVRPTDRAGAYDIDESGDAIVESYSGSYENIMGLPLEPLAGFGLQGAVLTSGVD